jgi:cytochrome c biogenesis protein CcdA
MLAFSSFLPRWQMRMLTVLLVILSGSVVTGGHSSSAILRVDVPITSAKAARVTSLALAGKEMHSLHPERVGTGVQLTVTVTPSPTLSLTTDPAIHLAYFSQAGCPVCARVNVYLDEMQNLYPQLKITEFPIEEEASKALSEWLGQQYGVPEEVRLSTPMIFVGQDYLVGRDQVTIENLQIIRANYVSGGAEAIWVDFDPEQSTMSIIERFRSFGILTIVGAGLVDGLNPCAFTTIVFFISYLTFLGRKGWEILAVGAAFALGVFLTYLLVGMGLLKVMEELSFLTALSRWIYGLTALLCLALAAFSLLDYHKARRGDPQAMALRIPLRLRRQINRVIRKGAKAQAFVPIAFTTGFVVSIIELACTGQVYLPTIIFVMGVPDLQERAFLYLLLYNLAFILPLVVVFGLVYFGTTSEQLGIFISRRTATIKLGTALLFLVLTGWLVTMLV